MAICARASWTSSCVGGIMGFDMCYIHLSLCFKEILSMFTQFAARILLVQLWKRHFLRGAHHQKMPHLRFIQDSSLVRIRFVAKDLLSHDIFWHRIAASLPTRRHGIGFSIVFGFHWQVHDRFIYQRKTADWIVCWRSAHPFCEITAESMWLKSSKFLREYV